MQPFIWYDSNSYNTHNMVAWIVIMTNVKQYKLL
jgi:hypothetical protein